MLRTLLLTTALCATGISTVAQTTSSASSQTARASQSGAQSRPAVLIADDVRVTQDRVLVATGNVEAFQGKIRLQAQSISFDQSSGQLIITGPITLTDGPDITILADQGQLSQDLQEGLLQGARVVMSQQLQLAAVELNRTGGRYTQLYKTSVTSCHICENGKPPLWQIRAKRVIHDQEAQQLYFDQAQFRIRNTPVFYLPRLRLPDPTLDRATGFLAPSLRTTSLLGTGIKVPYFIKLGDHRDLTVTPYLSGRTETLELRYRQAFRTGRISFEGAITRDELRDGETRGYLFGQGRFDLARDYVLTFDLETTSDDAYLTDYGFSSKDRLDSEVSISRAERDEYIRLSFVNFKTLRDGENNETLPTNVIDGTIERRLFPSALGGELRFAADAHAHFRNSGLDIDSADPDTIVDGRDVLRLSLDADWIRQWTLASGLQTQTQIGFGADLFQVLQDSTFPESQSGVTPRAAIVLRYPLVRKTTASTQILEPILQAAWTGGSDLNVPVEESTRVEFDEGNLLSLSRFPATDRRERGASAALGVNWSRFGAKGWRTNVTVGQVVRAESDADFSTASGLSGRTSDFLVAGQLVSQSGLSLIGRAVFDEGLTISKAELRGDWIGKKQSLSASYIWLTDDLAEDRTTPISELSFDGSFELSPFWTASANMNYDVEDNRAASAGIGFTYTNECVSVDLEVDRSYTSSTNIEPSTSLGFTVSLRGFSVSNGTQQYERSCGKRTK